MLRREMKKSAFLLLLLVLFLSGRSRGASLSNAQYFFMVYPGCPDLKTAFSQASVDFANSAIQAVNYNYRQCNFASTHVDEWQLPPVTQANQHVITATDAGCNQILSPQCPKAKLSMSNNIFRPGGSGRGQMPRLCEMEIAATVLANKGIRVAKYNPLIVIFDGESGAGEAGQADELGASFAKVDDFNSLASTMIHELGHFNLLGHAYANVPGLVKEYGDRTCNMGMGGGVRTCFNAPHSNALGWSRPVAVIDHGTQARDVWVPYNLPYFSTAERNHVVVNLGSVPTIFDNGAYDLIFLSIKSSKANPKIDQGSWANYGMDDQLLVHLYNNERVNYCYDPSKIWDPVRRKEVVPPPMDCPSDGIKYNDVKVNVYKVRTHSYLAANLNVRGLAEFGDVKVKVLYVSAPSGPGSSGVVHVCIYTVSGKCAVNEHFAVTTTSSNATTEWINWQGQKGLRYAAF